MGFYYSDQKKLVLKWIIDFVKSKSKIEYNELVNNIIFEHGSSKKTAEEYIKIILGIKKILYKKKEGKVFICPLEPKDTT